MIDLRSDTLTVPDDKMRKAMYYARVGDEGRVDATGKGEDPTINELEAYASKITGKSNALFVPSGTLGNLIALLTHCSRGDHVAVEENLHVYRSEKAPFLDRIGGLNPVFYETDDIGKPDVASIEKVFSKNPIRLLCIENTHNFAGGICLEADEINTIVSVAHARDTPVHMDGARIFNAAAGVGRSAPSLLESVDSVMFCVSKGIGAPVGSLLCGSSAFIREARKTKKLLGGVLRQAGVLAAAGLFALQNNITSLHIDHNNARLLAERIAHNANINIDLKTVQSNIVMIDISRSGRDSQKFKTDLEKHGLKVHAMSPHHIRMVTYNGISKEDVVSAADIFNSYCQSIC